MPPSTPKSYGPDLDHWAQFDTLPIGEIALMMKGIEPTLEDQLPEWADTDTSTEIRQLRSAVQVGTLVGYPDNSGAPTLTTQVSVKSLIDWLRAEGRFNLANGLDLARSARSPAATLPAVAPPPGTPPPVGTAEVASSFNGLKWPAARWKKALGNKPVWLSKCCAIPGQRGVCEARWNPVLIGAAIVQQGHAKPNSVRGRFQTKEALKPWLEEWKTYEAANFNTP